MAVLDKVASVARLGVQGVDGDEGAGQILISEGFQRRSELGYLVRLRTDLAQSGGQRIVVAHCGQDEDAAAVRTNGSA